jgi:hypothetical protein
MEFRYGTSSLTPIRKRSADASRATPTWAPRRFVWSIYRCTPEAARTWLHVEADVIDTEDTTAEQVARRIADAVQTAHHEGHANQ